MTDSPPHDRPRIEPEPPHPVRDRQGLSPRVLALIALAVVLVIIAVGAGAFRDRIARAIGPAPPVSEAEERAALRNRVAQLESELELARRQSQRQTPVTGSAGDNVQVEAEEANVLEQRIVALEAAQARMSRAAAAAVAAAALADAAEGSEPFAGELASLERLTPTARGIRALRELAEQGAPTRAQLAADYPRAAARAARAARGEDGDGFFASLSRWFGAIFNLRRIGSLEGEGVDAVLARAERRVQEGDLEGALAQLQSLPAPAREAMVDWTAPAERRVEIERRINALRAQALGDLSGVTTADTGGPL
ncbi:hypothetical protein [Brevundimonas sp.]|uniref:COG4223 family protein n=1 Tax=Brevundimonas sp. TaxID=1871086 RepID=UPI0025CEBFC9|nr:hypothetical protein [Brevundimonas sp.]